MGPEPIHQAQRADNRLQAYCQSLHAMGLEPIRTDSMNPLGCKPIDIQLCRAFAARPQVTVRPPVRWPTPDVCETHTPWTLGQWSLRIALCQQASQRSATATCNAGMQSTTLHNREWCPASLVVPIALRREGRTETLT